MIRTSETLGALATALATAQGRVKNPAKDANNPHFGKKYADLPGVIDAIRGELTANGIAVCQFVGWESSPVPVVSVTTRLIHKSGEWIEGTAACPVAKMDAQSVGSATTYLRRYSLMAVAMIAGDDDDDGNHASSSQAPRRRTDDAPASKPASAPQKGGMTDEQKGYVRQLRPIYTEATGLTVGQGDKKAFVEFCNWCAGLLGEERIDFSAMSAEEFATLIDRAKNVPAEDREDPFEDEDDGVKRGDLDYEQRLGL